MTVTLDRNPYIENKYLDSYYEDEIENYIEGNNNYMELNYFAQNYIDKIL